MEKPQIKEKLTRYVRKENGMVSATHTAAKVAKEVGCSKEELDAYIREEYDLSFSAWKLDPGIALGYPPCVSCGKHRRGRPYGRDAYQCLVCGNISEKRRMKYNSNGTVGTSDQTPISLPTLRGRDR